MQELLPNHGAKSMVRGRSVRSPSRKLRAILPTALTARYQNVTFVLLKNGEPAGRLVPDNEKVCVRRDLAEALAKTDLPENEAKRGILATFNKRRFGQIRGLSVIEPK